MTNQDHMLTMKHAFSSCLDVAVADGEVQVGHENLATSVQCLDGGCAHHGDVPVSTGASVTLNSYKQDNSLLGVFLLLVLELVVSPGSIKVATWRLQACVMDVCKEA